MFFVARVCTAHFDESYTDGLLMCVGGWLAHDIDWERIERQWDYRIAFENTRSKRRGHPPFDRYHASDMDNFKAQFAREKGWDENRRKIVTKKLIGILGRSKDKIRNPIGLATGIGLQDMRDAFPSSQKEKIFKLHWAAYRTCMILNLIMLAETMRRAFPNEQVAVICDRGPYNSAALSAFESFRQGKTPNKGDIVTVAPMGWEDCTALQSADLIAYEGRKLIKSGIKDEAHFRRSLQRIVSGNMVRVRTVPRDALMQIAESRKLAPPPPSEYAPEAL
jgi:hypothetical protein